MLPIPTPLGLAFSPTGERQGQSWKVLLPGQLEALISVGTWETKNSTELGEEQPHPLSWEHQKVVSWPRCWQHPGHEGSCTGDILRSRVGQVRRTYEDGKKTAESRAECQASLGVPLASSLASHPH